MSASTIGRGRRIERWSKRISSATSHLAPPTTWVGSLFRRDLAADMANVALRSEQDSGHLGLAPRETVISYSSAVLLPRARLSARSAEDEQQLCIEQDL
jgi:hypothetical protein